MKDKRIILGLFIAICVWQWYLLVSQISEAEGVRTKGVYIKIPCRPVDPIDPFRGTYLMINPDPTIIEFTDSGKYEANESIYLNYECNPNGDCKYRYASTEAQNEYSIKCKISYVTPLYKGEEKIDRYNATIAFPFAKYFINEKSAPIMTEKYNAAIADTSRKVYAGVHVHKGNAVLDALWIDGEKLR